MHLCFVTVSPFPLPSIFVIDCLSFVKYPFFLFLTAFYVSPLLSHISRIQVKEFQFTTRKGMNFGNTNNGICWRINLAQFKFCILE